jgi:serine/threonine protein kinase
MHPFNEHAGTHVRMEKEQGRIFKTGEVIGAKYVVLEFIGKGAFGEVYRAHQLNLQRDVAIKAVSQQWLLSIQEDENEVETALQRFRREVQAMARVRHPNVLQIFDHGTSVINKNLTDWPVEFIVIEYIPGETLRYTMSEEGFYPEQDLVKAWLEDYFLPVLDGVQAIHSLEIAHRDLKPENILLDGEIPKIADFGLARSARLKPVTQSMDVKGTAQYMSPEHFFDFRKADQRADIYSLGKILFEAIGGKIPSDTMPFRQVKLAQTATPFFEKLDRIVQCATAEKREDRLDSVEKLREGLLEALRDLRKQPEPRVQMQPTKPAYSQNPKWIWTGIALAILSVTAMTIWHLTGEPGKSHQNRIEQRAPGPQTSGGQSTAVEQKAVALQPSITTEDGAVLHLVPAGRVVLPPTAGRPSEIQVNVKAFYMDETPVTNHQYVQFLNQNLSTLNIAGGVVRDDNQIWLLLGKIFEGYEPIVFQNGKFQINNAGYASFPVLRVTAYGASAYARFYHKRLLTYDEWLQAMGQNEKAAEKSTQSSAEAVESEEMEKMHATMMNNQQGTKAPSLSLTAGELAPVTDYEPNKFGIRILDKGFGEWGLQNVNTRSERGGENSDYVILPSDVPRQPWEAFEAVGFRCVQSAGRRSG